MVKVLISDNLSPAAANIFRDRGIEVDVDTKLSVEELRAKIAGYEGLARRGCFSTIRSNCGVGAHQIDHTNLNTKCICCNLGDNCVRPLPNIGRALM